MFHNILSLHLLRYQYHYNGFTLQKMSHEYSGDKTIESLLIFIKLIEINLTWLTN